MTTIYTVPACDVVPGMLWLDFPVRKVWRDSIGRQWIQTAWDDAGRGESWARSPDDRVQVQLPGRSPRKLCCRCEWEAPCGHSVALSDNGWRCGVCGHGQTEEALDHEAIARLQADAPHTHDMECPVAPRPGVHGGMRLWPAPFKGHAWVAFGQDSWKCGIPGGCTVHSRDLVGLWTGLAPWVRDVGLASFCLPPTSAPDLDRRIPGPLADDYWAGIEGVAARVGRGEVKAVKP